MEDGKDQYVKVYIERWLTWKCWAYRSSSYKSKRWCAQNGVKRITEHTSGPKFGWIFASVRSNGVYTTLHQLGIQYEGRNVKDIFSHLINAISPDATTKEDIVARQAAQEALINVYEYVTNNDMDLSCIDNMPVEVMDKAMKSFLTEYIWATAMKDLESRVEQYMLDVSSACEREKELKDTIEAVIDIEYDNHGSIIQNDVNEAILGLTERCLSVLEGIV